MTSLLHSLRLTTQLGGALLLAACAHTGSVAQQSTPTRSSAASGTALVANQQSASATIIDVATQQATTIEVGAGPHEAAISPDGTWGVVTVYGVQGAPGNKLALVDMKAKRVARTIDLGTFTRPHGAAFVPGSPNLVVLTSETTQNVVIVDIAAGTVVGNIGTKSAGSHMLGITADGKSVFTANIPAGSVTEIDLATRAFVRDLKVSTLTEGIGVAPDGSTVWVGSNNSGTVSIVDTKTWTVVATLTNLGMPYRIGFSPDSKWAVICDPQGNRIHIADATSRTIVGSVESLGSPRGVRIGADNRTAFVTLGTDNAVAAIDLIERTVKFKVPVGVSPDGVGYAP